MKKEELKNLCERLARVVTVRVKTGRYISFGQKCVGMDFVDTNAESGFNMIMEPRLTTGMKLPDTKEFTVAAASTSKNKSLTARYRHLLESINRNIRIGREWPELSYGSPEELDMKLSLAGI